MPEMLVEGTCRRYALGAAVERHLAAEAQYNKEKEQCQELWVLENVARKRRGLVHNDKRFVESLDAEAEQCSMAGWWEARLSMAG